MTIYEFAKALYMSGESFYSYTIEDATIDLRNVADDETWEIPEDITAEELCDAMNRVIAEMKECEEADATSGWTVGDWIEFAEKEAE